MEPLREIGKLLFLLGGLMALAGLFLMLQPKVPFRLGRLPGDIIYQGRHTTFYFPIVTCIVLSLVLTLVFWLLGQFRR